MFAIARWEGLYGPHPADSANWVNGRLVGTMRGVTPAALARHRGVPIDTLTPAIMQTVTLEEAGDIALSMFYRGWIEPIAWNAAADVVLDFGWGAGPGQAVKSCERDLLRMNNADHRFDVASIAQWSSMVQASGVEAMVMAFYGVRERFYDLICQLNPTLQVFRQGWHNRAKWQTPGGDWWATWTGDLDVQDAIRRVDPAKRAAVALPQRLLTQGMVGADVQVLQQALVRAMPTLSIEADGIFGGRTADAVKAFQAARGLVVDGWVGTATRKALGIV